MLILYVSGTAYHKHSSSRYECYLPLETELLNSQWSIQGVFFSRQGILNRIHFLFPLHYRSDKGCWVDSFEGHN